MAYIKLLCGTIASPQMSIKDAEQWALEMSTIDPGRVFLVCPI
jgi:hypothetical protein